MDNLISFFLIDWMKAMNAIQRLVIISLFLSVWNLFGCGELKKIKPSLFEGESKEAMKAWLIDMKKYFQIYIYHALFVFQ